ncbi:hypothetical protein ACWGLF_00250 [Streptomyces puniciscabiei]
MSSTDGAMTGAQEHRVQRGDVRRHPRRAVRSAQERAGSRRRPCGARAAPCDMAALLAQETGDRVPATVAASALSAARNALIEEHHRRIAAGESPDSVAADAAGRAHRASGLGKNGLKGYAVRA